MRNFPGASLVLFPPGLRQTHAQLRARRVHHRELLHTAAQGLNLSHRPALHEPAAVAAELQRVELAVRDGEPPFEVGGAQGADFRPPRGSHARRPGVRVPQDPRGLVSHHGHALTEPQGTRRLVDVSGFTRDVDHHGRARPAPEGITKQHRQRGVAVRHVSGRDFVCAACVVRAAAPLAQHLDHAAQRGEGPVDGLSFVFGLARRARPRDAFGPGEVHEHDAHARAVASLGVYLDEAVRAARAIVE
mmetsp:Transcript_7351/g.33144  ORF Transcript_7351/g.33144 Transcript_7351/m.33144 type:complete len:246 (+) Transcript_7351:2933-3670(+)